MHKAADAAVEAAQQVFTAAENALMETKRQAAELKAEAQRRADELAELRSRTEKFGHVTLDAFREFQNAPGA
jgi:F0F1-type ATP synthase membrane subunit b/b'